MLLTIDVGNTTTSLGVFSGGRFLREFRLATARHGSSRVWRQRLVQRLRGSGLAGPWEGVVLASVVPDLDRALTAAAAAVFRTQVLRVTATMPLPVQNGYGAPRAVGSDRLVAAVAAVAEFGAPVIMVDFGTAVTVDAVSRDRRYLGGAILPGLELAADALAERTALLPRLRFSGAPLRRPQALGRFTRDSLEAGLRLGMAGAVSALIAGLRRVVGAEAPVVATGGAVRWVAPLCPEIRSVRPHLLHSGLREIWLHARTAREAGRARRSGSGKERT